MAENLPTPEDLAALFRDAPVIEIMVPAEMLFAVLGNLQLALRHPGNKGPSTTIVRAFADLIQRALTDVNSDLGRVCERGWHSCFDVERRVPR
jgi:hypothetical protein